MNILYASIGLLDEKTDLFKQQTITADVEAFIKKLLEYTLENKRTGQYCFADEGGEKAALVRMLAEAALAPKNEESSDEAGKLVKTAADSLLKAADASRMRLPESKRGEIRNGNLAAAVVRDEEQGLCVIFAKVDHSDWFDGESLTVRPGFSCDDKDIWKTAVVRLKEADRLKAGSVSVYMDNPAAYWTGGFLGLKKVRSDEDNTKTAMTKIQKLLAKRLSGGELIMQYSAIVRKMETTDTLNYPDFINELFGVGLLEADSRAKLRKELLALPEKAGFDTQFKVAQAVLPKLAVRQVFKVNEYMELTLVQGDYDPSDYIKTRVEDSGERVLEIRCTDPETFEGFERKRDG